MLRKLSLVPRWILLLLAVVLVSFMLLWRWNYPQIPSIPTKWIAELGSTETIYVEGSVAVSENKVYVVTKEIGEGHDERDYLNAVDAQTGSPLWRFNFSAVRETTPAVADGIVYFGGCATSCHLYAVDADSGQLLWKVPAGDYRVEMTTPLAVGGLVYFGTKPTYGDSPPDMFLYALDAKLGTELWKLKADGGVSVYNTDGNVLYFGNLSNGSRQGSPNYVWALNSKTGKELWRFKTTEPLVTPPQVANGKVYFTTGGYSVGHSLYAIDKDSGQERWHFQNYGTNLSTPLLTNSELYIGVNQQRQSCIDNCPPPPKYVDYLYNLDPITGGERTKSLTKAPITGKPIQLDGVIYSVDFERNANAHDAITGELRWRFDANGPPGANLVMLDGVLFIGSWYEHKLYAIGVPSMIAR